MLDALDLADITLIGHSMGGGEIVRYLSHHGDRRVARIALVGSTVPKLDVDPATQAAQLDQLRTGYGQWVAENAEASFGDGQSGCVISPEDKRRTIQDWLAVSLRAAVECTAAPTVTPTTTQR